MKPTRLFSFRAALLQSVRSVSAALLLAHAVCLGSLTARADDPPVEEEGTVPEELSPEVPLPPGIPKLPGPRERAERFVLKASNVAAFRPLLLAPVAEWLSTGMFAMRVVSRLDYTWSLGDVWDKQSTENFRQFSLDEAGTPVYAGEKPPVIGYPFGNAARVREERNPSRKARMILWNFVYGEGLLGDLLYEARLSWIGTQSLLRESRGVFYRRLFREPTRVETRGSLEKAAASGDKASPPEPTLLPKAAEELLPPLTYGGKGDLLGQELLQLLSPPVVLGYAHITWRFRGPEEDLVWLHSPVTGSNRQVLSANRSDPLLGGVLTPDDLFVWSTQVQAVNAKVLDEKVMLLPFAAVTYYLAEPQEAATTLTGVSSGELSPEAVAQAHKEAAETPKAKPGEEVTTVRGYYQRADGSYAAAVWNHESGKSSQFAPWVPLTGVLVPREVWILEITPRDPYYATGRQILVVDKESMLPFYKVIFDTAGDYEKTVMAAWSLAKNKDGSIRFPFAAFVLGVDAPAKNAMTFTSQFLRTFPAKESKLALSLQRLLDIRSHARDAKIGAPEKKPAESDTEAKRPPKPASSEDDSEAGAGDSEAGAQDEGAGADEEEGQDDRGAGASGDEAPAHDSTPSAKAPSALPKAAAPAPAQAKEPVSKKQAEADAEAGGF